MELKKGQCLLVKTTTKNDVFGTVLYRIDEVNMNMPDGKNDGIRLVMLGGSGPAARGGMVIRDRMDAILDLFRTQKAEFLDAERAKAYEEKFSKKEVTKSTPGGVIEMD